MMMLEHSGPEEIGSIHPQNFLLFLFFLSLSLVAVFYALILHFSLFSSSCAELRCRFSCGPATSRLKLDLQLMVYLSILQPFLVYSSSPYRYLP